MVDRFSKKIRSKIMSSIRSKNTWPELRIRKLLWASGKRYRIHDKSIFGTPDISSRKNKIAIFIDGCFWHGCKRCYTRPKTNSEFWRKKILANRRRRKLVISRLKNEDWKVLEIWEHQIESESMKLSHKISKML
jgi:DNA mismatch endonuclease, patch repair protein